MRYDIYIGKLIFIKLVKNTNWLLGCMSKNRASCSDNNKIQNNDNSSAPLLHLHILSKLVYYKMPSQIVRGMRF